MSATLHRPPAGKSQTSPAPGFVALARGVLWVEAVAVRLWPAACACALIAALALLGLPAVLPPALHAALLLAGIAWVAVLLWRAWPHLRTPGEHAAERRLERDSGLSHRPFATLRDLPAGGGAPGALWQSHQARARSALASLRLNPPSFDLPRHDPHALRAASVLLLVAGLAVAGPRGWSRLEAGLLPGLPGAATVIPPAIQAWIQPPAYTGLPPVFLPQAGAGPDAPVTVPTGSRLTVSITGIGARPGLSLDGSSVPVEALGHDSFQAAVTLTTGGRLEVGQRFSTLAGWTLKLLPNEPPAASWPSPPGRAGTSLLTRLPWHVQQRWGVARLEAELTPSGRPDLPARHIPLPLPGTPRQADGAATPDLSADPYAGAVLTGRLLAQDVSGQHGQSGPIDFILPAHEFHHPLARAIADLRRRLALHPDTREQAADELAALAEAPLERPVPGLRQSGIALNLSAAASLLGASHPGRPQVDEVQARLWTLALALDGALPDRSARELADARENLRHGIEEHAKGKLSDQELAKRLEALRQALDKRLADLAKRATEQGALQKFDPHTQHLSSPSIDRLVRKLEKALRDGNTDEARRDMAQLERMMDQLKNAHIMTPEEARQQREQARQGRQQAGAVQDMVQREGTLLDHSQTRTPQGVPPDGRMQDLLPGMLLPPPPSGQTMPGQTPPGTEDPTQEPSPFAPPPLTPPDTAMEPALPMQGATPSHPAHPAPTRQEDARVQRALHRALDALKDGLAQSGRPKPRTLDDASQAMQDAAAALAQSQDLQARDAIARAIAALQKGGQDMAKQPGGQPGGGMELSLQQGGDNGEQSAGQGDDEGQDEPGDGQGGKRHDPFGRPIDGSGTTADDPGLKVPDEMERARSRAIQEELRRRGADRGRPKGELDYIDRLLKPF